MDRAPQPGKAIRVRRLQGRPVAPKPMAPKMVSITVTDTLGAEALFDFGKASLRPEAEDALMALGRKIDRYRNVHRVLVTGHTDRIGSAAFNKALSERRASSVVAFLREHTEIPDNKFNPLGMGKAQPVVTCEDKSRAELIRCLQPNRRVEVEIVADRVESRAK